jgi:hypothetical protein
MESVSGLQLADDRAVGKLGGLNAFDRMMLVRIELLAHRFDPGKTLLRQSVPQLPANQLKSFAVLLTDRIAVFVEGSIEGVEHGKQALDQQLDPAMAVGVAFLLDAFFIIFEIRLEPNPRVHHIFFIGLKFAYLLLKRRRCPSFTFDSRAPGSGIGAACFGSLRRDWVGPSAGSSPGIGPLLFVATPGIFLFRV